MWHEQHGQNSDTGGGHPNGDDFQELIEAAGACPRPKPAKEPRAGRADGHHVAVFFSVSDHAGVCHNYHGTAAGWTVCDQSRLADFIPEPQQIAFRAWVMEGDDVLARSDFAFDSTS